MNGSDKDNKKIDDIIREGQDPMDPANIKKRMFNVLDVFGELFFLNLIFILFSLPLVTIGASLSALITVTYKLDSYSYKGLWSAFIEAFKKNFLQSTVLFFILMLIPVLLAGQYYMVLTQSDVVSVFYMFVMICTIVVAGLGGSFLFPVSARYENSIKETIKNSFLLAISNLFACIKVFCIWIGPLAISFIYPKVFLMTWYLWLLIMFSLMAYLTGKVMKKVFLKVETIHSVE